MIAEALLCAALHMGSPVPETLPAYIPHAPTQENLDWVGRQYPAYATRQRREGEVLGLYVPAWGGVMWSPPVFEYVAHESCHHIQYTEGRRLNEAECYAVQEECKWTQN